MCVLVVDDIRDDLRVVVLSGSQVLLLKVFSEHVLNEQIRAEFAVSNGHVQNLEDLSVSL